MQKYTLRVGEPGKMIELVLTINDRDGSYTEHAGVVLASIFSNTQQTINVHIVHDDSLSDENKLRLTQLVDAFHHNIFFYHVAIPGDFLEVAAGVNKIDYWTIASMYRLLLPRLFRLTGLFIWTATFWSIWILTNCGVLIWEEGI